MLIALSIRDVVLIERLDLEFGAGLSVLTGETGAGKSILLDALGLALGARSEAGLVRRGAEKASVSAAFDLPEKHPVNALLAENDIAREDSLVLKRVLGADGRSRAFVNDQPTGVGLLRQIGELLVEVHGQHDAHGLLDAATHRALLDSYGGHAAPLAAVRRAHEAWHACRKAEDDARRDAEAARRDEEFLRHALAELEKIDPKSGEEATLAEQRSFMQGGAKLAEGLQAALDELTERHAVISALNAAHRLVDRAAAKAGDRLAAALQSIAAATVEASEAVAQIELVLADLDADPQRLEQIEERLFALRALARKHDVDVDALSALRDDMARKLGSIDSAGADLKKLAAATAEARAAYMAAAAKLGEARRKAAARLDKAVNKELAPLKMEKASFRTTVAAIPEEDGGPEGLERIAFEVSTNPGAPPGPLARIASGGELARFMLSLKVALAGTGDAATLVFDEVDAGIGGAVADAVGERLARLGVDVQVLVVTHSPQVAARGLHHWQVQKTQGGKSTSTTVMSLAAAERREEIARMLAGAKITDEARAAAAKLLAAGA
ncbi:MAG TPA: DNA repair protein RecN [Alphaproteobacteria bacterium]|jgi:DNA repair protein RecN (Recombination protein N)